uniref:PiggyBac transposable element-derived protein domain-containing protein n=1 Tax=Sander lucioperca TaxID=283035 RepID=A0A8D0AN67_SANLU
SELDSLNSGNEEDETSSEIGDSERDSGEVTCMPEELDVANEIEIEEKDSAVTEEDRGGQEEMTVTRKEEIKWRHRPFTTIMDTSFENPPIHEDPPMRPYEYFKQYIPDEIFDLMADNTNVYAMQSGTLSFKPTSPGEIRTVIGLHLDMGVMKMPRVSMYWEAGMDIGIFQNTMPRDRFFQLRSHLHLVNNLEKPADNNDVFFKVRPLYDAIRSRCLELPLEENLCVDEQMVPFHGTLSVKQFIKGKPHPWGVKIYFLCGKKHRKQLGLGAGVVYHLSQRITEANHKLYFDNYFTTYNLLELLAERKIHAAGTARVSRFARPPLQSDKEMAKKPRGSCDEVVSRDGKVALVKWYDNRSVVMASNFVGVGRMNEVQRWDKKKAQFLMVSRPEVVKLYNEAMGGVDLLNQLVSLYRTEIRSNKWTLRMITHAFEMAVVNSWLEYRLDAKRANIQTKDIQDLLHFKMNVAQCLVRVHKTVAAKRGRPSMSPEPQRVPHRPAHRPVQDVRPLREVQYDMVDHMPNYDEKRLPDARCHTMFRSYLIDYYVEKFSLIFLKCL